MRNSHGLIFNSTRRSHHGPSGSRNTLWLTIFEDFRMAACSGGLNNALRHDASGPSDSFSGDI